MNRQIFIFHFTAVVEDFKLQCPVVFRKEITNRWLRSFLYYVPYVTLAVMTFPAIVEATANPVAGALALVVGIALAWFGRSLFTVAVLSCVTVFAAETIMGLL